MKLACMSVALALGACGAKSPPPSGPAAVEDDLVLPDGEPVTPAQPVTPGPDRATSPTLVAGHADARYEFAVPAGLLRLRGAAPDVDPRELSFYGADGIGNPTRGTVSLDSIVVFSDPEGLGADLQAIAPAARDQLLTKYSEFVQERFPSATTPRLVSVGAHTALRIDLPRVEMPDRPVRSGRHYLVLDGVVTVSVDCLWAKASAEQMSAACDAVAASLRRKPAARR